MTKEARKHVFVLGYDDAHAPYLRAIPDADEFEFHPLLHSDELVYLESYDIDEKLEDARKVLRESDVDPDAIICHWDFPVVSMLSILCSEYGLPAPTLEASLRCSHKYWSRLSQHEVVPENTPGFCAFDPFDDQALEQISLDFPFWIKPIKGYGSALGFKITSAEGFEKAMKVVREEIDRLGEGIDAILHHVDLPDDVADVRGNYMIAEEFVNGKEFAPEGRRQNGEYRSHGFFDMVRAENGKSFLRYEYPSRTPDGIRERADDIAARVLEHIGFDDGCFNVEFFWDREEDRLWIIEINPRISQSHCDLFWKVDGMSNHEVAVHVALGDEPRFSNGGGQFRRAAKYHYRRYDKSDAVATRVPGEEDLEKLKERQLETKVQVKLEEGMRLSELLDEDVYSYALAELTIGADSVAEMEQKYAEATSLLPFEFEPVDDGDDG